MEVFTCVCRIHAAGSLPADFPSKGEEFEEEKNVWENVLHPNEEFLVPDYFAADESEPPDLCRIMTEGLVLDG